MIEVEWLNVLVSFGSNGDATGTVPLAGRLEPTITSVDAEGALSVVVSCRSCRRPVSKLFPVWSVGGKICSLAPVGFTTKPSRSSWKLPARE